MQVEGLAKKEVLMGGTEKHQGEILVGVSRAQEQHSKSPASPAACAGTHKWDSPREKEEEWVKHEQHPLPAVCFFLQPL